MVSPGQSSSRSGLSSPFSKNSCPSYPLISFQILPSEMSISFPEQCSCVLYPSRVSSIPGWLMRLLSCSEIGWVGVTRMGLTFKGWESITGDSILSPSPCIGWKMGIWQTEHLRSGAEVLGYMCWHFVRVGRIQNWSMIPRHLRVVLRVRGGLLSILRAPRVMKIMQRTHKMRLQAACGRW